jgi:hypothetical protein
LCVIRHNRASAKDDGRPLAPREKLKYAPRPSVRWLKVGSDEKGAALYFCKEHTPQEFRAMIENSPVYASRNPFV